MAQKHRGDREPHTVRLRVELEVRRRAAEAGYAEVGTFIADELARRWGLPQYALMEVSDTLPLDTSAGRREKIPA